VCSALCTTGVTPSCQTTSGTTARAYCGTTDAEVVSGGGQGMGDVGYCITVCDCTAQCVYAGVATGKCIELEPDAQQRAGGRGVCVPVDATGGTEITVCQ
jgi:hypothetical protein